MAVHVKSMEDMLYEISDRMFLTARSAGAQLDELMHTLTHRPTLNAVATQNVLNTLGTDAPTSTLCGEYAFTRPILGSVVGAYVHGRRHELTGLQLGISLAYDVMVLNDAAVALINHGFSRRAVLSASQVEALVDIYETVERGPAEAFVRKVLASLHSMH